MKVLEIKQVVGKKLINGTLPDVDTDFAGRDRPAVKAYMERRFGETQVCSVGTFTTLQLKGVLKDLDKQFDNDFAMANLMTAIIDNEDISMKDLFKRAAKEPRLKRYIKQQSQIFRMMPSILEQPKTRSIHSCAMIIFPDTLKGEEWCPLRKVRPKGQSTPLIVSEWGGGEMDDAGFLKEDILGIKQLDKFTDILNLIEKNGKEKPDIYNLPEDPEVYRYFSNGWSGDVFQFGTDTQVGYTRSLKPKSIEDLIAAVALCRPGPMENHYHEIYVKCKNEGRPVEYLWGMENITKDTYGILCYQEQIMQVCSQIGGLSDMEADDVRRAMGKKKEKVLKAWRDRVEEGFLSRGCPQETFNEIWNVLLEFAKYSFNRSHAAAYAKTGYASQYLKVHYPIEYWTVALDYAKKEKGLKFLSEIFNTKEISIVSADINGSDMEMSSDLQSKTIYWGLSSIKGIGLETAKQIIEERNENGPFKDLIEFIDRFNYKGSAVKKQTYEALIACGAFDRLMNIEGAEEKRNNLIKQFREYKKVKVTKPDRDQFTVGSMEERWWWQMKQKELTGLVFIDYKQMVEELTDIPSEFCSIEIASQPQHNRIIRSFGGYIVQAVERSSAKGKFMRLIIEANYNLFNVMIWSEEYARFKKDLKDCEGSIILFNGELAYDVKWAKGNQFTLNKSSRIKILK